MKGVNQQNTRPLTIVDGTELTTVAFFQKLYNSEFTQSSVKSKSRQYLGKFMASPRGWRHHRKAAEQSPPFSNRWNSSSFSRENTDYEQQRVYKTNGKINARTPPIRSEGSGEVPTAGAVAGNNWKRGDTRKPSTGRRCETVHNYHQSTRNFARIPNM